MAQRRKYPRYCVVSPVCIPCCRSLSCCWYLQFELCTWLDAYLRKPVVLSRVLHLLSGRCDTHTDEWTMHPLGADAAVTVGAQS